jgi:uncharacterized membrane protein YbhN (UPF0104 family)
MVINASFKRFVKHSLSLVLVVGLIYYLGANWDDFGSAFDATWQQLAALAFCVLVTWVASSIQSLILLRFLGVRVGFWENLVLFVAMILGNYLPMRLGSVIRMRYFKKIHDLQYGRFVGITGVKTLILLFFSCLCVGIGLIWLKGTEPVAIWAFMGLLVGMMMVSAGALLIPAYGGDEPKNALARVLSDFFSGFSILRSCPRLFWQLGGLVLVQFLMLAIRLRISFETINVELTPSLLFILAPATTLVAFLSLTPGNIGLREWTIGVIAMASGLDFGSSVFAASLDRGVLLVCTFLFGSAPLAYVWLRTTR